MFPFLVASVDGSFFRWMTEAPLWEHAAAFFIVGICVGSFLSRCIARLPYITSLWSQARCRTCGGAIALRDRIPLFSYLVLRGKCRACGKPIGFGVFLTELGTGLLFAAYAVAVMDLQCQSIPEAGNFSWIHWRVVYHLVLLSLLVVATGIDLELYIIPDSVTVTGMLIGVIAATCVGNLQLLPLWVDWNQEFPGLYGPYIPQWIKDHSHLHGFAWSMAGLIAGGGITWLVRAISALVLGRESLGFGDVTLMAMVGSFIGWQPVVFAFMLAPMCGVVIGLTMRLCSARTAVPYGPYLSFGTVVVMLTWRWIWTPTHFIFGHWPTLVALFVATLGGLAFLLGGLRMYRMIPTKRTPLE